METVGAVKRWRTGLGRVDHEVQYQASVKEKVLKFMCSIVK